MTIVRIVHNKENPFVQINKAALWDKNLSLEAIGLWARLLSRPDNWQVSVAEICKSCGSGKDRIYRILRELKANGYAYCMQDTNEKGQFGPTDYFIFEFKATAEEIQKMFPHTGFPDTDNPVTGNPDTNNIDVKNIEETNISLVPDSDESPTTESEDSSEASKMARYLLKKRDEHFPKMKEPRIDGWIKTLDLMNRRDGRSWEEIKAAIDFAMEDAFWCKNILSAEKLREQYDKLYAKMTPVQNKGSIIEINRTSANKLLDFLISENEGNRIRLYKDHVYIPEKQEKVLYSLNPSVFEELICKLLGVSKK